MGTNEFVISRAHNIQNAIIALSKELADSPISLKYHCDRAEGELEGYVFYYEMVLNQKIPNEVNIARSIVEETQDKIKLK